MKPYDSSDMLQLNEVQCGFLLGFSCGYSNAMAELRAENADFLTKMKNEMHAELDTLRTAFEQKMARQLHWLERARPRDAAEITSI